MKIRLGIFALSLSLLPPTALLLSGQEWVAKPAIAGAVTLPALISALALISLAYLLDTLSFRRSGSSLLRTQLNYALWLACTGAILGAQLSYLNTFSSLWISPLDIFSELFFAATFGGLLLPTILIIRLSLASIPLALRLLSRLVPLPGLPSEAAAWLLLLAALSGLLGGVVWPAQLFVLLWLAPLSLLLALQLFWHQNTLFSGLVHGDWSRVILGATASVLVGGGALWLFKLCGGALYLTIPITLFILLLSAFGWLCLQLADLIAENGRGKSSRKPTHLAQKKPFPIPVTTKKD